MTYKKIPLLNHMPFLKIFNLKKYFQASLYTYFTKMLLSYIFIIILPVILLSSFFYSVITNQSTRNFNRIHSALISDISTNVSSKMKAIEDELLYMSVNPIYSSYRKDAKNYSMNLYDITQNINTLVQKHDLLYSIYFFDQSKNKIYSTASGGYDFTKFYDKDWVNQLQNTSKIQRLSSRINMDKDFLDNVKDNNNYNIYTPRKVLSIAVGRYGEYTFLANIDVEKLYQNLLHTYSIDRTDYDFFFVNSDGNLIYTADGFDTDFTPSQYVIPTNESKVLKDSDYVYFVDKAYHDILYCVIRYNRSSINKTNQYYINFLIVLIIVFTMFLFFVAITVAKRLYKPINLLYQDIKVNIHDDNQGTLNHNKNEIEVLKTVFQEMKADNNTTKELLNTYQFIVAISTFQMYIKGIVHTELFIENSKHLFQCKELLQLLVFKVNDLHLSDEEKNIYPVNLQEIFYVYLQKGSCGIMVEIEPLCFTLLITAEDNNRIAELQTRILSAFFALTENQVYAATTTPFRFIHDISQKYALCSEVIEYASFYQIKSHLLTPEDLQIENKLNNSVVVNYETSLITSIINHDGIECNKVVDSLYKQLSLSKNKTYAQNICSRIIITLDKEFKLSSLLNADFVLIYQHFNTLEQYCNHIRDLCDKALAAFSSNDLVENKYCIDAKQCIEDNYMNNIDISYITDSLNLSYPYLSKIFKSHYGISLSEYLNTYRINKGKELLQSSELTVSEIAQRVGYNNIQSFQRFFKKYCNISPADYRKHYTITSGYNSHTGRT